MPEDIALFIDFENIRYSMLNIQRREPDPQELIAVARRYGTVMVARAYADWSRQPEPFKGSLTAAMIDRVDCPAKQRDRIRMGTFHYTSGNTPTGALGSSGYIAEQGAGSSYPRSWPNQVSGNSGPLPALNGQGNGWNNDTEMPLSAQQPLDNGYPLDSTEEPYSTSDYQQRESYRSTSSYQTPSGSLGQGNTGPLN